MNNLETERLILRIVNINDTETIYNEILANKETLHFLDWPYCNNIEEAYGFMKDVINKCENDKYFFWIIEEKETKNFVGCILICNIDTVKRMAEIEYVASSKFRGKGYIPEANKKVIEYLIKECNYYRIEAVCNIENIASSRVMEKSNMKFEGILRGRALNLNEEGNPGDLKIYSVIPSDLH